MTTDPNDKAAGERQNWLEAELEDSRLLAHWADNG